MVSDFQFVVDADTGQIHKIGAEDTQNIRHGIPFAKLEQAEADGYSRCETCFPPKASARPRGEPEAETGESGD